ncbi:MAG: lipid A-modifier LpxR family protein, partial [Flavicella sp.]
AKLKKSFLVLLLIVSLKSNAQTALSKTIEILNENDLFVSTYYDRYYTNGLFVSFRFLDTNSQIKSKTIHELQIGHQMYTPQFHKIKDNSVDRPYAGYAFLSYNLSRYYKNYAVQGGIELGAIGPISKAAEIQNTLHQLIGYPKNDAWIKQIQNQIAINIEGNYIRPFSKNEKQKIDFISSTTLKIGTIHTHLSTNVYTRFNLLDNSLNRFNNSILINSNLYQEAIAQRKELFIYCKPQINYNIYDATIQGRLPNESKQKEYTLIPVNIEVEVGIKYAYKKINLSYSAIRYSKKLKEMIENSNTYGAIKIAYLFD